MVTGSTTSRNPQIQRWLCVWPGLVRLWIFGDFSALLLSAGFAILLNLALLSTFVWPQWLGIHFPIIAWSVLLVVWLGSWFVSSRVLVDSFDPYTTNDPKSDALFIAAQTEYLKGNWHEAEALIMRLLRFRPRDIEARLLLATIHFHAGSFDESQNQLDQLNKLDAANRWRLELDQLEKQVQWYLEQASENDRVDSETPEETENEGPENEDSFESTIERKDPLPETPVKNEMLTSEPKSSDSVLKNKKAA